MVAAKFEIEKATTRIVGI